MRKFLKLLILAAVAGIAYFVYWDQLPPEKKRRYIDATEAFQEFCRS